MKTALPLLALLLMSSLALSACYRMPSPRLSPEAKKVNTYTRERDGYKLKSGTKKSNPNSNKSKPNADLEKANGTTYVLHQIKDWDDPQGELDPAIKERLEITNKSLPEHKRLFITLNRETAWQTTGRYGIFVDLVSFSDSKPVVFKVYPHNYQVASSHIDRTTKDVTSQILEAIDELSPLAQENELPWEQTQEPEPPKINWEADVREHLVKTNADLPDTNPIALTEVKELGIYKVEVNVDRDTRLELRVNYRDLSESDLKDQLILTINRAASMAKGQNDAE